MFVTCGTQYEGYPHACGKVYDDTKCWTICPHNPLDVPPDAVYCRRCDLFVGFDNLKLRVDHSDPERLARNEVAVVAEPPRCLGCGRTADEVKAAPR